MDEISILVVDENEEVRRILSAFLTRNGFSCLTADSAEKAVSILNTKSFNILVTDTCLAGSSGLELARHVKELYPRTAVLCVMGSPDAKFASEAVRAGVLGTLIKPLKLDEVKAAVNRAVRLQTMVLRGTGRLPPVPGLA